MGLWTQTRIHTWNQPVLSIEGTVSCSRKQQELSYFRMTDYELGALPTVPCGPFLSYISSTVLSYISSTVLSYISSKVLSYISSTVLSYISSKVARSILYLSEGVFLPTLLVSFAIYKMRCICSVSTYLIEHSFIYIGSYMNGHFI